MRHIQCLCLGNRDVQLHADRLPIAAGEGVGGGVEGDQCIAIMGQLVELRTIAPAFGQYVSRPAFEWACRQYLWRALRAGAIPPDLAFTDAGTWWGAGDARIDVMAVDGSGRVTAAGSCKWTEQPMDVREYAALQTALQTALQAAKLIDGAPDPHLFLFSRAGFGDRLREIAHHQEPKRLHLIGLEELYAV